ncbi:MAG: hypothetical protein KIS68_05380 [Bauldia sp.]|nr:hypothetical protein [Bauldia sp.]
MSRTHPPSEHDYAAIEAAVMETERGRWFLAEHAARHRVADTEAVLAAIGRMEAATPSLPSHVEGSLKDIGVILAMARAGARGSGPDSHPPHLRPMQVADGAITAVRRVSEKIQEVALELRETEPAAGHAEALDVYCRDLETASVLQEKAILQLSELASVVDAIEERLATLLAALGARQPAAGQSTAVEQASLSITAPPIQPEASSVSPATGKEPPRRTLLLVQPLGPKR